MLTIILVHIEGSCLSSETNHARNSVQNVIFCILKIPCDTIQKTFVCVILCLKSVVRLPYVLAEIESLQTLILHVTIEYTFDLAEHNVERLNVSCFVTGGHMFQPRY